MRGAKVKGHSSMVRTASCPGAIVNTDNEAGLAAFNARKRAEEREALVIEQQQQIDTLTTRLNLIMDKIGMVD